jgi:starch synthase (maltosyl-transferring)
LCFEKATAARDNVVIVAINLDPRVEQGADLELSWQTFQRWGIDDHASLAVTDELTGNRFEWRGRWQHVRLDPSFRPYGIWRIAPAAGLPRDEPEPEPEAEADIAVPEPEPVHIAGHPELDDDFPPGGAT